MTISNSTKVTKKYTKAHKEIEKYKEEYKQDINDYIGGKGKIKSDEKKKYIKKFLMKEKAYQKFIEEKNKFFAPLAVVFGIISPIFSFSLANIDAITSPWKIIIIILLVLIPILLSLFAWAAIGVVREAVVKGLVIDLLFQEDEYL